MKNVWRIIVKIAIGLCVNLLTVLSCVFNLWEFVRAFALRIAEKIPNAFVYIVSGFGILGTVALVFNPNEPFWSRLLLVLLLWLVLSFLIRYAGAIAAFLCAVLSFVLNILGAGWFVNLSREWIFSLGDCYINYCPSDIKPFERIYVFGICALLYWVDIGLEYARQILALLAYPAFAVGGVWVGYWFFFRFCEAPDLWSADWWLSIGFIVISTIIALCIAYVFNETMEASIEDSNFGLFDVFEQYWAVYANFFDKQSSNPNTPMEQPVANDYYILLAACTNLEDLKQNYKRMAKDVHPDVSTLPAEEACKRMAQLNEAYEYLRGQFIV